MRIKRIGKYGLYEKLRGIFSDKNKGRLSKLLVYSGLKPTVNYARRSSAQKGTILFSADFEMSWAFRYSKAMADKAVEKGLAERKNVPLLVKIFENHDVPVTWATVGHLFLQSCERNASGRPHPDMPRPPYFENRNWSFKTGDWFEHDPCSNVSDQPAWYASDLVDRILASRVGHEIACHTFSHIDFSYGNCSKELAEAELDACIRLAEIKHVQLKSMVFPGGTFGNFESLKEKGFVCYRKPMEHHIDLPRIDPCGLVAIPSSLGLDRDPYGWSKKYHLWLFQKFLKKAAKTRMVCHFWFHPSMDECYLKNIFPEMIEMAAGYRNAGILRICTMAQLAEETLTVIYGRH